MKKHLLLVSLIVGVSSFSLTSCNSKEKQVEIDKLTEELERSRKKIESEKEQLELEREDNRELTNENNQLRSDLRKIESRAKSAEREVERFKARDLAAKEVTEREPSSREIREAAEKTAAEQLNAIVTITGDQSSGSGTLVSADDKTWIYFPAEAVVGNSRIEITTSEGTKLDKFGSFEIASDTNLARLELKSEVSGSLTPSSKVEIESGFPLLGVGESNAILEGRAYDVTTENVSGGSRFSSCGTGTPVFSGETAELLGILVAATNEKPTLWPQRAGANNAREVCRLDRAIKWTPLSIATLLEEAKTLADADRLTRLVLAFAATTPSASGISFGSPAGSSTTSKEVFDKNKSASAVKSLFALDEWLKERGDRAAKADLDKRVSGVYGDALRNSKRNTKTFSSARFSPYHAKAAAQSLEWRKEAEKKLGEVSRNFE